MAYDQAAVGRRLKSEIIDKGYTVDDFADAMGVTRQAVYPWISGETALSFERACEICDFLGISLERLAVRETA